MILNQALGNPEHTIAGLSDDAQLKVAKSLTSDEVTQVTVFVETLELIAQLPAFHKGKRVNQPQIEADSAEFAQIKAGAALLVPLEAEPHQIIRTHIQHAMLALSHYSSDYQKFVTQVNADTIHIAGALSAKLRHIIALQTVVQV